MEVASESFSETLEKLTKQVAKGGGIAFGGFVIGKVAAFGLQILLGRVLGPETYGIYVLGTSVTKIAQSVGSLRLNQGIVRFCAMYRGEGDNARVKATIQSALIISLISSVVIASLLFAFAGSIAQQFFQEQELTLVLRVLALALPFYVLMVITTSFAQSFRRIDYQQIVKNIIKPLSNLFFIGSAFLIGFQLNGALVGYLLSGITSASLGFYYLKKIFPEAWSLPRVTFNIKQLLRFSLPLLLIGLAYLLLNYTDRIMLGFFGVASEVGIYNAASTISLQITVFLSAFISILSPIISDLYNRKMHSELNSLFKTTTKWVLLLSLPLFLLLTIFPNTFMLAYGPAFVISAPILTILAFAQLINIGTGPVGMLLQMTGRQDIEFFNGLSLVAFNIGLNIWLIPLYGALGAAVATGVSLALIHIARLVEVYKLLQIFPYDRRYTKPILAGVMAALAGIVLNSQFSANQWYFSLTSAFITLLVYILIIWMLGLEREDKMILRAVKQKIVLVLVKEP